VPGSRLVAWQQTHLRRLVWGLIVAAVLVSGAIYQAGWQLWARSHFQSAQQALEQHAWSEALTHAEACLRGQPKNRAAHLLAARAARRLERLDLAEEHLDACQQLEGSQTQAIHVERALLRVHRGGIGDVAGVGGVEEFLRASVAQDDLDAVEILDILSAAYILHYRVADAQSCLDDLLRRQPEHFHALVRRGWTAQNMSLYAEAIGYLDKALALRPDADAVRLSMAEIQVAIGRFAQAQTHFELLRERQPDNPSVLFGLARCWANRGRKEEAIPLLDQILARYPSDWKALSERGGLVEQDRPAEAEGYLRRAEALAPPDLPLLVRLADCLRLVGKEEEARTYREKADRLKADIQRAAQLGDQIREQKPNDPALRRELGCLLLRLGKQQDALHWFQTALEKDPGHQPTHESLATFYDQVGNFERAAYHRRVLQKLKDGQGGGAP